MSGRSLRWRTAWRAMILVATIAGVSLACQACAFVPKTERLLDGGVVATRLQRSLGLQMVSVPGVTTAITLQDVLSSYVSRSLSQRVLITTFDSPRATFQITGAATQGTPGLRIFRRGNVVVLYQRGGGSRGVRVPDLSASIVAELAGSPKTLTLTQPS